MSAALALIFDMDGVLIDSNPVHRQAWETYNRRFGIETGEAMHRRIYGRRNDEIVRDFFGSDLSDEEVFTHGAAKEALYREMMLDSLEAALVPGLRDFLELVGGGPVGLGTNAEPANVDFVLDTAGIRHYFDAIVSGHDVKRPKPHPEIYLEVARRLDMAPANCVVLEDSHPGIEAARRAGMGVIGITTGHAELPGVDLAIGDFRAPELRAWLEARRLRA